MDPPYRQGLEEQVLAVLKDASYVSKDTMIIVEASLDTDFSYLGSYGFLSVREKRYKTNMHVFVRKA